MENHMILFHEVWQTLKPLVTCYGLLVPIIYSVFSLTIILVLIFRTLSIEEKGHHYYMVKDVLLDNLYNITVCVANLVLSFIFPLLIGMGYILLGYLVMPILKGTGRYTIIGIFKSIHKKVVCAIILVNNISCSKGDSDKFYEVYENYKRSVTSN